MSGGYRGGAGFSFGDSLSSVVRLLIAWNVIFFLIQFLSSRFFPTFEMIFGLVPKLFWHGWIWQAATYMFLHGGLLHLLFNMLALWIFGSDLEHLWGSRRFLTYYFVTGVGAGLTNALVERSSGIPIVGASGAIYGLLLAFGTYFPNRQILLYFLFPIRAKYFVILFGLLEFFASISGGRDGIAHWAHLGGLVVGFLYLRRIPWRWLRRSRRRKDSPRVIDLRDYYDRQDRDSGRS